MYKKLDHEDILKKSNHRPWPLPTKPWLYYQEWNEPVFMHWPVEIKDLEPFIPEGLEIDLLDGQAWVSLVAFTIQIKPRFLPAFPMVSTFEEINLRTYVRHKGKSGVYFLSIEGSKRLSCWLARRLSGLPYRFANIVRTEGAFHSLNATAKNKLHLNFSAEKSIRKTSVTDIWLTERYALFHNKKKEIFTYEVHHIPWKLQRINMTKLEIHYPKFQHLIGGYPVLMHYSPGVQVLTF
ncbi:MAG: DUF2071 domain-containing protein [Cryomorphaceae bacterium]|nr:DUF2071 domain-containing protein [Cryomorphaceae bacterium]